MDCKPVFWSEVLNNSNFKSFSEIDTALRTYILSLRKEIKRDDLEKELIQFIETFNLAPPTEGDISPFIQKQIFSTVYQLGYKNMIISDDFNDEEKLAETLFIKDSNELPSHANFYTEDIRIQVTTHWDSHCTFICSSKEIIDKILNLQWLEGFYCSKNTEVYWGLHPI